MTSIASMHEIHVTFVFHSQAGVVGSVDLFVGSFDVSHVTVT